MHKIVISLFKYRSLGKFFYRVYIHTDLLIL